MNSLPFGLLPFHPMLILRRYPNEIPFTGYWHLLSSHTTLGCPYLLFAHIPRGVRDYPRVHPVLPPFLSNYAYSSSCAMFSGREVSDVSSSVSDSKSSPAFPNFVMTRSGGGTSKALVGFHPLEFSQLFQILILILWRTPPCHTYQA